MSLSLENARLYNESQKLLNQFEREMEIARKTQMNILPEENPIHKGYDFGSLIIPARAVGGDFYDFINLGKKKLGIVIGDISDKGLPAALFMALTYSLIRTEVGREEDPSRVLQNVNRYLLNMHNLDMFVTVIYAILEFRTGCLTYARAGHQLPIILDIDAGFVETANDVGQPLGLFENVRIDFQKCTLPKKGIALFFSDGLNEALGQSDDEFGLDRIRDVLLSSSREPADAICNNLWSAVQKHTGEIKHQDDFAAIALKRHEVR